MNIVSELSRDVIDSVFMVADKERKKGFVDAHNKILEALESGSNARCDAAVELHYKRVAELIVHAELSKHIEKKKHATIDNSISVGTEASLQRDYLTGL